MRNRSTDVANKDTEKALEPRGRSEGSGINDDKVKCRNVMAVVLRLDELF